jgi:hypothetical protein
VPETTVAAAPFALLEVAAVEAGRETVEEARVLVAWLLVLLNTTGVRRGRTDLEADADAEEADGSEEMAARIVALKEPSIWSRLFNQYLPRGWFEGTYVNLAE